MPTVIPCVLATLLLALHVLAFPSYIDLDQRQAGTPVVFPPRMEFTGAKLIPDAAHPYIAPRRNDLRGPCPGLNTLANHGYLPRHGIVSTAQLIQASQEGFNLGYNFTRAVASLAVLTRGNPLLDRVSIGGPSPLVPALPGAIDGVPGGLSKHGRFEGDVSMTRRDSALGDPGALDIGMLDEFLEYVDRFGEGDIVTQKVVNEYRFHRFQDSVARNPTMVYQVGRFGFSYGEGGFIMHLFADGITRNTTRGMFESFFRNERFPGSNWHRRAAPFEFPALVDAAAEIIAAHPVPPGKKNAAGTYVPDTDPRFAFPCGLYFNLVGMGVPSVLLNTTGLLRRNVDKLLMEGIYPLFADLCDVVVPEGPAGV